MSTMSARFQTCVALGAVALFALAADPAAAQKKPPPAPPPAGSIIYLEPYRFEDYQMKADGTARTPLLPGDQYLEWSQRRYGAGGARWCLSWQNLSDLNSPARWEVVARRIRNQTVDRTILVTDFSSSLLSRPEGGFLRGIRWTKGTDGFFAVPLNQLVLDEAGVKQFGQDQFYRVNVSAADLEAASTFQPVGANDARLKFVFDVPASTTNSVGDFGWSPNDATPTLAWAQDRALRVYQWPDGDLEEEPSVTTMPTTAWSVNWSVAGDKIAVTGMPHNQSLSGIVAVNPFAVVPTATLVKAGGSTSNSSFTYSVPAWSPQGSHLVALKRSEKRSGGETAIVRLNADGSGETSLNVLGNIIGGNEFVWDWMSDDIVP
jgi:hypothetical protein